jgi:hypothetical protein
MFPLTSFLLLETTFSASMIFFYLFLFSTFSNASSNPKTFPVTAETDNPKSP